VRLTIHACLLLNARDCVRDKKAEALKVQEGLGDRKSYFSIEAL